MVISTSLSLGLIIGFVSVQGFASVFWGVLCCGKSHHHKQKVLDRVAGMYSAPATEHDDPEPDMLVPRRLGKNSTNASASDSFEDDIER